MFEEDDNKSTIKENYFNTTQIFELQELINDGYIGNNFDAIISIQSPYFYVEYSRDLTILEEKPDSEFYKYYDVKSVKYDDLLNNKLLSGNILVIFFK